MVATRRAAPVVSDELAMEDPELALKKKPVRKATAKTTKTAPKPEAMPKATRGKKAQTVEEVQEDEVEDVQPTKPAKKAPGRPKKEVQPEPAVEVETIAARKPTRATKDASVRGRKAIDIAEDSDATTAVEDAKPTRASKAASVRGRKAPAAIDAEPASAAEEQKTTKATKTGSVRGRNALAIIDEAPALPAPEASKATRSTRTIATKAPPLSPKKITQVLKQAARTTRAANQKPAAKTAAIKAPTRARATRKRTESNENADPDRDVDTDMVSTTPVQPVTISSSVRRQVSAVESEASMSSRPTTPNDSAAQSFNHIEDDVDELQQDNESIAEEELTTEDALDSSDDELNGPKTPLKRASPGATARYQESVQRTIRKYEEGLHAGTPARRFDLFRSQRGTPQTQKPYCKPLPPTSAVRAMTVARGADRAFVFQALRSGAPSLGRYEEADEEEDLDMSFIPDDNIIPMDEDDAAEPTPTPAEILQLEPPSHSDAKMEDEATSALSMAAYEDDEAYIAPSLLEPDPDETVLVHDIQSETVSPEPTPVESFETEETVLIHRSFTEDPDHEMEDNDETESDSSSVIHTDNNEWRASITSVTPIAVNFDEHLADVRQSPQKTLDEAMKIVTTSTATLEVEDDAVAGAEMDFDLPEVMDKLPSRRETINLNDFFDVAALSEPTIQMNDIQDVAPTVLEEVVGAAVDKEDVHVPSPQQETQEENSWLSVQEPVSLESDEAEPSNQTTQQEEHVPHYALPTVAFDARRKSLPVLSFQTPTKMGARPNTSDGASLPRIANSFTNAWWSRQISGSTATSPAKSRPSTAHSALFQSSTSTPVKASKSTTPVATPRERFPRLAAKRNYEEHARTAAPPARFHSPAKKSPKRRETFHKAMPGQISSRPAVVPPSPVRSAVATPQVTPGERYPRLRPRQDYEEHAKTAAAPVRFRTPPARTPIKRPATTQKPESMRKATLRANTSHTPIQTPLKGPAMTPAQVPMTPHPAAPLRGIIAMVEVYTLEGASASAPFVALLHRLGAKTTRAWSDKVTHVVFKDGSPTTLQRVRLHNKEVEANGKGSIIRCVNSRWVNDCDSEGTHKDESDEAYVVDIAEVPRGGKRRRKSMEPSALMNLGGNIVRDRKSSLGRASVGRVSSLGRSPLKFDSPAKQPKISMVETPKVDIAEKENSEDGQSSPATPAWIAAPDKLVQQTAPMNRIRKLELQGGKEPKNRRLTFWNGGA